MINNISSYNRKEIVKETDSEKDDEKNTLELKDLLNKSNSIRLAREFNRK